MSFTSQLNAVARKQLIDLFNYEKNYNNLEFTNLYCDVFSLYLEGSPTEAEGCRTLAGHTQSIAFATYIYSFSINSSDTTNNSVPLLLTRISGDGETVFAISEKVRSTYLVNYSIITLYVSVILVIGRVIRGITYGKGLHENRCLIKDNIQ